MTCTPPTQDNPHPTMVGTLRSTTSTEKSPQNITLRALSKSLAIIPSCSRRTIRAKNILIRAVSEKE